MSNPKRKHPFTLRLEQALVEVAYAPGQAVWINGYCDSPKCPYRYSWCKVEDLLAEGATCKRCNLCKRRSRHIGFSARAKRKHRGSSVTRAKKVRR